MISIEIATRSGYGPRTSAYARLAMRLLTSGATHVAPGYANQATRHDHIASCYIVGIGVDFVDLTCPYPFAVASTLVQRYGFRVASCRHHGICSRLIQLE